MKELLHQGDIIKIENIARPVLVASKAFFNQSGEIIGCPITQDSKTGPLHIWIQTDRQKGYVNCEKMALLDLNFRGYTKLDRVAMSEMMNISDAIQSIFDYI